MPHSWTNWAGQQRCAPAVYERPGSTDELAELVAKHAAAGRTVRAVGAGHSFTDIVCTDDVLVDLGRMDRLLSIDPATGVATAQAGITLHTLAEALHARGRALENQGDIDHQTLAGALATATHGTGAAFRNMSSLMVGGRLVTAVGEVVDLARDPDLLRAARVSLGALGVLAEIDVATVPAFRLRKVERGRRLDDVLAGLDQLVEGNDHFEVYAFPWSDRCLTMASRRTDEPASPQPVRTWVNDDLLANRTLGAVQRLGRRAPAAVPTIGRLTGLLVGGSERCDDSYKVFATDRKVRFTEMEQALPATAVPDVLTTVLDTIRRRRLPVSFPIEVRFTAADDAPLSTAYGRATGYVAVHQYVGVEYESYFRAVEAIAAEHAGRPHWGKRHYLQAVDLAPRYPEWDLFAAIRARLDPAGTFTNGYVRRVLG